MSLELSVVFPNYGPHHPNCLICHGKGSGLHYGVNTCNACKVCNLHLTDLYLGDLYKSVLLMQSNRRNENLILASIDQSKASFVILLYFHIYL